MTNADREPTQDALFDAQSEIKKNRRTHWLIGGVVGAVILAGLIYVLPPILGIAAILFPPPVSQEDRYYHINQFLEEIDYKNAGEVLEEEYDAKASHPLNPTWFRATLKGGEGTFETLQDRIVEVVDTRCQVLERSVSCRQWRPAVDLILQDDGNVLLALNDTGTGR